MYRSLQMNSTQNISRFVWISIWSVFSFSNASSIFYDLILYDSNRKMSILLWTKQQIKIGHNVNFDHQRHHGVYSVSTSFNSYKVTIFFLSVVIIFYCMTPIKIYPHFNTFFQLEINFSIIIFVFFLGFYFFCFECIVEVRRWY